MTKAKNTPPVETLSDDNDSDSDIPSTSNGVEDLSGDSSVSSGEDTINASEIEIANIADIDELDLAGVRDTNQFLPNGVYEFILKKVERDALKVSDTAIFTVVLELATPAKDIKGAEVADLTIFDTFRVADKNITSKDASKKKMTEISLKRLVSLQKAALGGSGKVGQLLTASGAKIMATISYSPAGEYPARNEVRAYMPLV